MKLVVLFGAIACVYMFSTTVEAMPHHHKGKNPGMIEIMEHLRNGRRQQQGKNDGDGKDDNEIGKGKDDDQICEPGLLGKCWSISFLRHLARVQSLEQGSRRRDCKRDEFGRCFPLGDRQG
uniref:Uncharacterized protein n=1 Tax=Anopheles farauti TaxID=69004 RepID=A0A182QT54_9DIPT